MEKLQNAVIINGVVYEFIDEDRPDECEYCDLKKRCEVCLCLEIFGDVIGKRFKERTDI